MQTHLIFVYNADAGLFNTVTDIAHKILSPNTYTCNLCALTHGHFRVKQDWVTFLEGLPVTCDFLHRDEFRRQYGMREIDLPAVLQRAEGGLSLLIPARDIAGCPDIAALKTLIERRLAERD